MLQFHSEMLLLKSYSLLLVAVFSVCIFEVSAENTPVVSLPKVIFDTDLDSDVDDVGALAMLLEVSERFFSLVQGTCVVASDGSNTWENNPSGPHSYVVINPLVGTESISKYIDELMAGEFVP
jgi:hypothetical protein